MLKCVGERSYLIRRSEKKILILIMERPRTPDELCRETGWGKVHIGEIISRLQSAGDVYFDGKRYSTNRKGITEIATASETSPRPVSKDSTPEWLKNPPQPLPRRFARRKKTDEKLPQM